MNWYNLTFKYPLITLVTTLAIALVATSGIRDFRFDASADTLVIEDDPALQQYNRMSRRFSGDDFVVMTYQSNNVLSPNALAEIDQLQQELSKIDGISSTYSILDAPLLESPPVALSEIANNYKTLRSADVDTDLARAELTSSPLFSRYLISADARTTAISANLAHDDQLSQLRIRRDEARRNASADLTDAEAAYKAQRQRYVDKRQQLIDSLRQVRDQYQGNAKLFVSGVPTIAADMLGYVRSDLEIFGGLVLLLIVTLLAFFFRKPRWVLIPLFICMVNVAMTMGVIGLMDKPVTVVSSNFIALLAIISISFSIHLIVRYRELLREDTASHQALVTETMRSKFKPCLYTALTTLLAFGSMLGSGIVPVIDFGWMMCIGIVLAMLVTYLLFPTILLLLGPAAASRTLGEPVAVTQMFQHLATYHARLVVAAAILLVIPAFIGVSKISFDNRFIDYFSEDTEIHQGMAQIDRHLGGTLPLDIYLRFESFETPEDDLFSDFAGMQDDFPERYWYTPDKIAVLGAMQQMLENNAAVGKVLSLASMEQVARQFNDGRALSGVEIAYVLGELPDEVRGFLITPYSNPESGWMRVNARISESLSDYSKTALINDIKRFTKSELELESDRVIVTGMVVLFNDMLKQLADSQMRTLLYVISATFLMFSVLLRSLQLALIALLPNILAASLILAVMGYSDIPMDMMTITIAAICIGIGVDDAIHYLHRYRHELDQSNDPRQAVDAAHQTIGRAMYFTTMTITGGFSILAFSNFVPTVYFGLLTALAMVLALIANLALLPALLIIFSGASKTPIADTTSG